MRTLILVLLLSCFLLMPQTAWGISIALAWDPPASGIPDGYRMFYRFDGQAYDYLHPAWEGPELTCWIRSLPDTRIRFVVRAYNAAGESGDSNEATYTPTSPPALSKPNSTQISAD
jgi:hypothetical protein